MDVWNEANHLHCHSRKRKGRQSRWVKNLAINLAQGEGDETVSIGREIRPIIEIPMIADRLEEKRVAVAEGGMDRGPIHVLPRFTDRFPEGLQIKKPVAGIEDQAIPVPLSGDVLAVALFRSRHSQMAVVGLQTVPAITVEMRLTRSFNIPNASPVVSVRRVASGCGQATIDRPYYLLLGPEGRTEIAGQGTAGRVPNIHVIPGNRRGILSAVGRNADVGAVLAVHAGHPPEKLSVAAVHRVDGGVLAIDAPTPKPRSDQGTVKLDQSLPGRRILDLDPLQ